MFHNFSFFIGLLFGTSSIIILYLNIVPKYYSFSFIRSTVCNEEYYSYVNNMNQSYLENLLKAENDRMALDLFNKVPVICWILTAPKYLENRAIHVKNTWTKRCHKVLFMSSVNNETFPTVGLNTSEGRQYLTDKCFQAFQYLYNNHLNDSDWFLKADDDTYVIMENLRYFLSDEDPNEPVFFGQIFKYLNTSFLFPSGGAGYVLSRESLRRFGERKNNLNQSCKYNSGDEDVEMSRCLQSLGVKLKPSLDNLNRHRFHWTTPETYLGAKFSDGFKQFYDPEGGRGGIEGMSNYPISFHYISGEKMHELEYYIYHIRPYGMLNLRLQLNNKTAD